MSKTVLNGYILVPDNDLAAIQNALPAHIRLTKQESGCLVFRVTPDDHNRNKFHVYEEFANKAAFEAHQTRVRNSSWGKVSQNVERFYEITEVDE